MTWPMRHDHNAGLRKSVPETTVSRWRTIGPPGRRWGVDKYEYFRGLPEVGIVPRAPHAGPLLRHVYEQEHGRGGFSGKVTHTYHLYPPTNWLPGETRVLDGFAPAWESPLRPIGGTHLLLNVAAAEPARGGYRGVARVLANAPPAMNVTAPPAPQGHLFGHPSGP